MQIFKEKQALKGRVSEAKNNGKNIGFVPTMGALHEGHLSLVSKALQSCDTVVVSVFVNPTQFDNPNDLELYPRTLEKDIELLSGLSEDLLVFSPSPAEVYGEKVVSEDFSFDGLEFQMEGRYRKGHFNGVGTVVRKLFEIVQPDKAFFGEKDFQQLQIIRKLVEKLKLDTEIIGCPIDREANGLARSSRNERLNAEQRLNAKILFEVLTEVKDNFGTKSASELTAWVEEKFERNPDLKLEYFEIADTESLMTMKEPEAGKQYRAFLAAYAGEIRLIDNIALN